MGSNSKSNLNININKLKCNFRWPYALLPPQLRMLFGSSQIMMENMIIGFYTNVWSSSSLSAVIKAKSAKSNTIGHSDMRVYFKIFTEIVRIKWNRIIDYKLHHLKLYIYIFYKV